jgi:hypothetical protein
MGRRDRGSSLGISLGISRATRLSLSLRTPSVLDLPAF